MSPYAADTRCGDQSYTFTNQNGEIMQRLGLLLFGLITTSTNAADLISPFAGSEEIASYRTDFDRFQYLNDTGSGIEKVVTEGRLSSRLFVKPSEKSSYEVFKSYENELEAAGFEVLASLGDDSKKVRKLSTEINKGDGLNAFVDRAYKKDGRPAGGSSLNWLATFTEHYIAARKTEGDVEYLVVVLISDRRDLYAVDVLETAAMQENTVALSLDALRAQMASQGRVAVYGILFDTGSATMRPDSKGALEIIAQYLGENPQRSFYVVGHTDDQGSLAGNLQLSQARAESTVKALLDKLPGAKSRLSAHGVGPLSPVATNEQEDGRQLNRRVELVSTID